MKDVYEVYICRLDGVVLYIGEGAFRRHKHCNSGVSHVYELNKLHFEGKVFDIQVLHVDTKEERKRELIRRYLPKYNKDFIKDKKFEIAKERALFKKVWCEQIRDYEALTDKKRDNLYVVVDEFMRYHTYEMLKEEGLMLRGHGVYRTARLPQLSSISRNLRGVSNISGSPLVFKETLERTYEKCFGVKVSIGWKMTK